MAHDPSLGFADYFSASSDATAVMPAMEEGAPELFGLHADMELLGMRGLAAMPAAHAHGSSHSSKAAAVLIDAGGGADATVRFLSDGQHHQAPLSLSLCRPDVGAGMQQQHHLGGSGDSSRHHQQQQPHSAAWMHAEYAAGGAWHLRSSRFLLPTQQLLQDYCSLPVDTTKQRATTTKPSSQQEHQQEVPDGSSASWAPSPQIQAMDAMELQRLKDKLYIMLEEVDRRYRRYCEQMRSLAGGFEAVAGDRAAAAYTALASRTISRHFRSLRDGVVAQLQAVRKALGDKDVAVPGMTRGDTPRLRVLDQCIRQQKVLNQAGMMESHPWRPQRGLPERAVTILRAWLFEHFLHPYPSDVDKHILARQTGLSRSQVSNWFINARVRLWKPMVEEMYVEEMKGEQQHQEHGGGGGHVNPNPSSSQSQASEPYNGVGEAANGGGGSSSNHNNGCVGVDRKPTREQLLHDHDAGSLAAVVNVGGGARLENFGLVDFDDAYDGHHHQQAAGFGGGVSLTLGLQQQHADSSSSRDTGVNIAFGAPPSSAHHAGGYLQFAAGGHHHHHQQMEGSGHHVQFGGGGAAMDGEAAHGQEHYRSLSAGFHLLRDLAG